MPVEDVRVLKAYTAKYNGGLSGATIRARATPAPIPIPIANSISISAHRCR